MGEKYLLSIIEKLRAELSDSIGNNFNFGDPAIQEKSKKLDRALNLLERRRARRGS
jgi:hypothetical protein